MPASPSSPRGKEKFLETDKTPWLETAVKAVQFGTIGILELLLDVGEAN